MVTISFSAFWLGVIATVGVEFLLIIAISIWKGIKKAFKESKEYNDK